MLKDADREKKALSDADHDLDHPKDTITETGLLVGMGPLENQEKSLPLSMGIDLGHDHDLGLEHDSLILTAGSTAVPKGTTRHAGRMLDQLNVIVSCS